MAMTCNATRRDGWQNQAGHLTLTHAALGAAAIALAGKVRRPSDEQMAHHLQTAQREPDDITFANKRQPMYQLESGRANPIPLPPREVHKIGSSTAMREKVKTLTARSALAERKIAELTMDLSAAKETGEFLQNENNSLLTSLDLMTSESARQSQSLKETEAAVNETQAELEKVRAELETARNARSAEARSALERLATCQGERDALAAKARPALERLAAYQAERNALAAEARSAIARLKSDLVACQADHKRSFAGAKSTLERLKGELAAAHANRAELSATLDQTRAKHQAESNELKTRLSATIARAAAAENLIKEVQRGLLNKLDSFQNSVAGKDYKIQELEQSLSKLTAATNALLQSFKSRDAALASADDKLTFLAERVAQLETDAIPPPAVPQRAEMRHDESQRNNYPPQVASAHHEAAMVGAVGECLFEVHVTDHCGLKAVAPNCADTLLAETIDF
jgi:chromosome segregation ATPase